jgi:hypothetical protein
LLLVIVFRIVSLDATVVLLDNNITLKNRIATRACTRAIRADLNFTLIGICGIG